MTYPIESLDPDEDDGTMPQNVERFAANVVGRRIVDAEVVEGEFLLTLDDAQRVAVRNTNDCCAYTELESFLLEPRSVDHVILGVGTTDEYTRWHIYADAGDILELTLRWSAGNPFYYGYGFEIEVVPPDPQLLAKTIKRALDEEEVSEA